LQNYQHLQEKDFSPPFSIQGIFTKWGESISKLIDLCKAKNYSFKIFYHELQNNSLIEENQQLRGQKKKAELDLAAEQPKRLKIERKLEDVIRDSENRKKNSTKKNSGD